ncbi:DUF2795 domain-containing protein [Streptomyces halobius]|uniref:DUF2795 domain-containing protein n=1 Tax=Streptomyces halobius TaxID=2879846 RepID=A0ABY4MI30_9ACTN|nr:DUF2795 domain-containing protein [Streptomyces halobius]UQA97012.1 DUF2795 domain-containing protein [Streptomyces halobius]
MEHGTEKIGPARDDLLKKQIQRELAGNRSVRAEEERDLQPAGGEPLVAPANPDTVFTGAPPRGMTAQDVGVRSELAQHLGRSVYPAGKSTIIATLRRNNAPDELVALAERLPQDERFGNIQSIAQSLGLGTEEHRG